MCGLNVVLFSSGTSRFSVAHMPRFVQWWIDPTGTPHIVVTLPIAFQEKGEASEEEEAVFIMGVVMRGSIVEEVGEDVVDMVATLIKILVPMMVGMGLNPPVLVEWFRIRHHPIGIHHNSVRTGFA